MYYLEWSLYPVCVTPQSQQPLGNLDAELRRALSPETVQGGNRVQPPAAGFTLGRFQVGFSYSLKYIWLMQLKTVKPLKLLSLFIKIFFLLCLSGVCCH